ncbi:MAG: hypothetical protein JWQ03_3152, partial [Variovorax sp.]|nr:hypothetical protein [Variovorax sp.]
AAERAHDRKGQDHDIHAATHD